MRNFLFESVWMLSHRDKTARFVELHPKKNLIWGRNHTGKSSLVKTLFLTLGARPQGKLDKWDEYTVSLVTFQIDGQRLSVLHKSGMRALFYDNGELHAATSDFPEWCEIFSGITGFNLILSGKNSHSVQADPNCFFLPFYINQDGSWQSSWSTFPAIHQFKDPYKSILDYFSGVKPPEYYKAKVQHDAEQLLLADQQKERSLLEKARDRLSVKLPQSGPKLDPENFKFEIEQLTREVTELNKEQERLREKAVSERDLLSSINKQVSLAKQVLGAYEHDAMFLRKGDRGVLVCPVCHAEHKEAFIELLSFVDDARSLYRFTEKMESDASEIQVKINRTLSEICSLEAHYQKISRLLNVRRGELQFHQVIESIGAEQAYSVFAEEFNALDSEIANRVEMIRMLKAELKSFDNRKRSSDILKHFRDAYSAALFELSVSIDKKPSQLNSRPKISGSAGPRAVLAYYAAIWALCYGEYGSFNVPLVIDSPNQQGQDDINLPKVISFVTDKLPSNAQLILGSELKPDQGFDNEIILDRPYNLLEEQFYEDALAEVGPLEKQMFDSLSKG
ncbi:hypothetical protein [Magnetofaba australis]|uniref:Rad50/SbcC-type AAA domain-containing protein n=1 Tax=Magnetofaba australis IT-1 TaxID=1434232 RepID=A0A1Y2K8G1_9PROT|nr:hypothetical protein [Magnetofaba australis]OSM07031.1 hypothetical protein MAIT1_00059 [Magnetofaba australis IT-1]